jgi:bacterioferritin (cytochrome b1)
MADKAALCTPGRQVGFGFYPAKYKPHTRHRSETSQKNSCIEMLFVLFFNYQLTTSRRCDMPRYLVLANQTAASPELTSAVREILEKDPDTEFVLLVPATAVEDLLDWQEGDSQSVAKRTAQAAKEHLESVGATVTRTDVGDASPVKAIENELEQHHEKYDGIVISTLPLQRSRWVALDQPRRIERRFKLPVRHVVGHSVTMTRQELINGLNEDLNLELEALLRSVYHAAAGRGLLGHELRELLKKELPSELEHATFLADKIVALGGEVRIKPGMPEDLGAARDLLQQNIASERKIINNYAKRIDQAAEFGDKGLVIRLENILASETDHLEQLERLGR